MMQAQLLEIVNSIKRNKYEDAISDLSPELRLREDLNFDSFDLAELTVKIEEDFQTDIFADGLVNTVGEIYSKLQCFS